METAGSRDRNAVAVRLITLALVAGVAVLLLPFVAGLIGAAVFHALAAPLTRDVVGVRNRRVASITTLLGLFIVLVLPGAWMLVQLLGQVPDAVQSLQASGMVQRLLAFRLGTLDVGSQLQNASADLMRWSSTQTLAALGGISNALLNVVIALFGAYYLLTTGDRLWPRVRALLPLPAETSDQLRVRFQRATDAMLLGVVSTGAAQGAIVGVVFALLGFEHALLWGAVTAAASILPMFGSALVWGPACVVLFAQQRATASLVLALVGVVIVSNIDNVLRLVVFRRVSHIHPMVTLIGAFAGVKAFGIAGLLVGPLVLSYAVELLHVFSAAHGPGAEPGTRDVASQGFPLALKAVPPTSGRGVAI